MRLRMFALFIVPNITFADSELYAKVSVGGVIVESACTIATENMWQEVRFGHVIRTDSGPQSTHARQHFAIRWVHCVPEHEYRDKWLTEQSDDTLFLNNDVSRDIAVGSIDLDFNVQRVSSSGAAQVDNARFFSLYC